MNALALGAAGQLGSNVVRALLQKGHRVRAFRRKTSNMIGLSSLSVEVAEGDLMDPESIRRALQGCDALLHAAPTIHRPPSRFSKPLRRVWRRFETSWRPPARTGVGAPRIAVPFGLARWASKVAEWGFSRVLRRPAPVPAFFVEVLAALQHDDQTKALRELGLPQNRVQDAIRDAVGWFREHGYL